jgi:hypothetical protein
MKFNKWTLGLAALGVVSLASVASAEEKQNFLQTALSSTTISGYVDTSIEYTACDQASSSFSIPFRGASKRDGFNLNVVKLSIEKPLDESEWAAGYKVDLLFGPDAVGYNTSANAIGGQGLNGNVIGLSTGSELAIKQAYIALRAPLGNGLEFKVGTFDTIVGYEVFEAGNNPNFTRSLGYAIEPTQHTGILVSYRVNDMISLSAGVANTLIAGINARNTENGNDSLWQKAWMGSIALTAPESWGWAKGSSLYGGVVYGFGDINMSNPSIINWPGPGGGTIAVNYPAGPSTAQVNYYAGLTLNTPVAGLKAGIAFDHVENLYGNAAPGLTITGPFPPIGIVGTASEIDADVLGIYASYQATEKLSLHVRGELGWLQSVSGGVKDKTDLASITGTVQYDLWQNVVSRLEVRWDQVCNDTTEDSLGLYANIIYKF